MAEWMCRWGTCYRHNSPSTLFRGHVWQSLETPCSPEQGCSCVEAVVDKCGKQYIKIQICELSSLSSMHILNLYKIKNCKIWRRQLQISVFLTGVCGQHDGWKNISCCTQTKPNMLFYLRANKIKYESGQHPPLDHSPWFVPCIIFTVKTDNIYVYIKQ